MCQGCGVVLTPAEMFPNVPRGLDRQARFKPNSPAKRDILPNCPPACAQMGPVASLTWSFHSGAKWRRAQIWVFPARRSEVRIRSLFMLNDSEDFFETGAEEKSHFHMNGASQPARTR